MQNTKTVYEHIETHHPSLTYKLDDDKKCHSDSGWAYVEYHESGVVKTRFKAHNGTLPTLKGPVYEEYDSAGFILFHITGSQVMKHLILGTIGCGETILDEAKTIKRYRMSKGWKPQKKRRGRGRAIKRG